MEGLKNLIKLVEKVLEEASDNKITESTGIHYALFLIDEYYNKNEKQGITKTAEHYNAVEMLSK